MGRIRLEYPIFFFSGPAFLGLAGPLIPPETKLFVAFGTMAVIMFIAGLSGLNDKSVPTSVGILIAVSGFLIYFLFGSWHFRI